MKRIFKLSIFGLAILAMSLFACKHHEDRGNINEPKTQGDPELVLSYLKVHDDEAKDIGILEFNVGNNITTVTPDKVIAKFNYGNETNKKIDVTVAYKGGASSLNEGDNTLILSVPAVPKQHKVWSKEIKVTRAKKQGNPIVIAGYYIDNNIVTNSSIDQLINKDSCTLKITVRNQYEKVEIDGEVVNYVAGANAGDLGSYSKEITGIVKGTTKRVNIKITDAAYINSPFNKNIMVKHEDASSYVKAEIDRIWVGETSYKPATDVNGKNVTLTGDELNLSVIFKNNVQADREKLKFILDDGSGDKTKEVNVVGKRVDCKFTSMTQGEHDVKIERYVQNECKDTFTFKVTYSVQLEKIHVANFKIENEGEPNNTVIFAKKGGAGKRSLSELELAEEANLYEYIFSQGNKISITLDVITEGTQAQYKVDSGSWTTMAIGTKTDISLSNDMARIEIKITKSGSKDVLYRFKVVKKIIRVKAITVGATSYTWEQFSGLTEPIDVSEDKITITASWENTEPLTPTLKRNNKAIPTTSVVNKTATWTQVPLEAGETTFRLTLNIPNFPWKNKVFKVRRPTTQDGNTNVSEIKIFGFRREKLSPKRVEWAFAKEGMNEFDLYIKPESSEVQGIKMKEPSEAILSKTVEAGYEGYYKANLSIISGNKIIFEVKAKDGSTKEYFIDKKGELKTGNPSSIACSVFIKDSRLYYDSALPSKTTSSKKSFDNNFLVEVHVSENKTYFMFYIDDYAGFKEPTFTEGATLQGYEKNNNLHEYTISYDTSTMQTGDKKDIEIHLNFESPTGKTIDLFQYAKYTIKLIKD